MTKHNWIILLLVEIIIMGILNTYWNTTDTIKVINNQIYLEHKLDSVLTMQKEIYKLDSCYLKATRIHMGQCAFELREGIDVDINN